MDRAKEAQTTFHINLPFKGKHFRVRNNWKGEETLMVRKRDTEEVEALLDFEKWGIICNYLDNSYTDWVCGDLTELGKQIMKGV